ADTDDAAGDVAAAVVGAQAAGSAPCCKTVSALPSSGTAGQPGYGGGVPPKTGQCEWWAHQSHSRDGRGLKSPVAPADWMACQIAIRVFSKRSNSASSGE